MMRNSVARLGGLIGFWMFASVLLADGGVRVGVSTRETYVGVPVTLQIAIDNASEHDLGAIPEVDGLSIRSAGPASTSTQISTESINGVRRTTRRSSTIYTFIVTAQREGTFSIPPIKVSVDGVSSITKVIRIVASGSETGDLMFVEVTGDGESVYVGQPLKLSLKVWIRPFRDRDTGITTSEDQMWRQISDATNWGVFSDRMNLLAQNRRRPRGREVLREDADGDLHSYFVFEVDATVYPDRPGELEAEDLNVVVDYPTRMGRRRSVLDEMLGGRRMRSSPFGDPFGGFSSGPQVVAVRPIAAEASVEPIEVKPIPSEGRPDDYRGAVGQYQIVTEAEPTRVKVGDPVSLRIGIQGTGPMDRLRAPPLDNQDDLVADFKVPAGDLPGYVSGQTKEFAAAIRPRNERVLEIPAIRFSYFDPVKESFETAMSDPIKLRVDPSDTLSLDSILDEGGQPTDSRADEDGDGSVLAQVEPFLGEDVLDDTPPTSPWSGSVLVILIAPPVLCGAVGLFARRDSFGVLARLFIPAKRRYLKRIDDAESCEQIAEALESYLIRRFGTSPGVPLRSWAIGQIRSTGHSELAIRVERLFSECDRDVIVSKGSKGLEGVQEDARAVADEITSLGRPGLTPSMPRPASTSTGILLLTIAGWMLADHAACAEVPASISLTEGQKLALLAEADRSYRSAASARGDRAKQLFGEAAEKYSLVVRSGVANHKLYFNLAISQMQSGQLGHAIANYRRALRIDPGNHLYRRSLAATERRIAGDDSRRDDESTIGSRVRIIESVWTQIVPPAMTLMIAAVGWFAFWGILASRICGLRAAWKTLSGVTLIVSLLTAFIYFEPVYRFTRPNRAVLVDSDAEPRSGDGDKFPAVSNWNVREGDVVQAIDFRSGWVHVRSRGGQTGWVEADSIERI